VSPPGGTSPTGTEAETAAAIDQAVQYLATTGLMAVYEQIQEDDPEEE
jgi:hypothetical protein